MEYIDKIQEYLDKKKELIEKKYWLQDKATEYSKRSDSFYAEFFEVEDEIMEVELDIDEFLEENFEENFQEWYDELEDVERYWIPTRLNDFLGLEDEQALKAQFIMESELYSEKAKDGQFRFELTHTSEGVQVVLRNIATDKSFNLTEGEDDNGYTR